MFFLGSIVLISVGYTLKIRASSGLGRRSLHMSDEKVGLIIVDHGSRREAANAMLHRIVDGYKAHGTSKIDIVEAAHMELAEPSIEVAFDRCVQRGATRIVCHPFFLSMGRHVQEDIPALMELAAKKQRDAGISVEYTITLPLGVHDAIIDLIDSSVQSSLDGEIRRGEASTPELNLRAEE